MAQLSNKIRKYLDREVDFQKDVILQDDGDGSYIKEWNVAEAKPTAEQLNTFESDATKLENNNKIRATRKKSYGNIGDQLDEIFKDIDAWKTRIQKIKTDNPKE